MNVAKPASGLNNEFLGPSFASLNEANKTALDCFVSDFSSPNFWFLSVANLEATKVFFRKFFPRGRSFFYVTLRRPLFCHQQGSGDNILWSQNHGFGTFQVSSLPVKFLEQDQSEKRALELEWLKIRYWCSTIISKQFRVRYVDNCCQLLFLPWTWMVAEIYLYLGNDNTTWRAQNHPHYSCW